MKPWRKKWILFLLGKKSLNFPRICFFLSITWQNLTNRFLRKGKNLKNLHTECLKLPIEAFIEETKSIDVGWNRKLLKSNLGLPHFSNNDQKRLVLKRKVCYKYKDISLRFDRIKEPCFLREVKAWNLGEIKSGKQKFEGRKRRNRSQDCSF